MKSPSGGRVIDVILVMCAIASTGALVARTLRPSSIQEPVNEFRKFEGWKEDLLSARAVGRADAPYRLLVWTHYQCPACKQFEREIDRARAMLGDSLVVLYRNNPLEMHPLAFQAAVLAECARRQGRFEAMHSALFATKLSGDTLPVDLLAVSSKVDSRVIRKCLSDSIAADPVLKDMARVKALALRGTPALQIGDRMAVGGRTAEELVPLLKAAR